MKHIQVYIFTKMFTNHNGIQFRLGVTSIRLIISLTHLPNLKESKATYV